MSKQKHIFIFIGPPGAGKGSLSQLCRKRLGLAQLSTGDLCRRHIAEKTEIGQQIDFFIQSGKLIPDSLVIDMVEKWLLEKFQNLDALILDGFPRTLAQAEALDELLMKDEFSSVQLNVLELNIDDQIIIDRLSSRLICPNKECGSVYSKKDPQLAPREAMMCDYCPGVQLIVRSDDTPESVVRRLESYHKHAQELVKYYEDKGRFVYQLAVDRPIEEVYSDFVKLAGFEKK